MRNNPVLTTAQRRTLLIAQGAMFRLGLTESTHIVGANLQPNTLAKSALNSLVTSASSALGHGFSLRSLSNASLETLLPNLQTLLPIAISTISLFVKRRSLIKPLLIGAIALGTASTIARFTLKKKRERQRSVASRNHENSQHR
jgi:hypothetical protein